MLRNPLRVARKELAGFFSSPVAYIFLGAFLAVTLFVFFWADAFFARNIADVRPLFEWMPLLLIFLVAAVTMRMWSEERRMGTVEYLLTLPVTPLEYLAGKFLAALSLVVLALVLTLPLPLTVSFIGPLDWGPVWGGYLAALFLGAAYISIGLFLSTRSDNQIVSLISTVLVCGLFYLLGSDLLTGFFGNRGAELLKLFGTGSRFDSITRGVIDLRDLYYYLSLIGIFFALTLYSLERLRWDKGVSGAAAGRHRLWGWMTLLLAVNLLAGNLWLQKIGAARVDLTEGRIYSISPATRQYLAQLREPLLIRGYFSSKTHPLLAPLVPRLRDLIREYQIAGQGKVRAEFVDPQQDPDLEAEANQKYGIRPVPFQVADRYQTALVNSYFQILVQYGDQYQVLGFRDLIEVKERGETGLEVELRNPEYELTRCIKRVMYGFQGGGDLFASLPRPLTLHGYISADARLPKFLQHFKQETRALAGDLQKQSKGRLKAEFQEPEADGGQLARKIEADYGFRPMQASLFDTNPFFFYLTLDDGDQTVPVALPHEFTKEALRQSVDAALKRFSAGYLKTVALALPQEPDPYLARYGMGGNSKRFSALREQLQANYNIREVDLNQGRVPETADILVLAAPEGLDDKGLFAVDQFLMKGGTVLAVTSPFKVSLSRSGLNADKAPNRLLAWLKHCGIDMDTQMVLDDRSQPFPIPVTRNVGGFTLRELRMIPYPYFLDVRAGGLNAQVPVTAGLDHVMLDWASPIHIDDQQNQGRKVTWLLKSSPQAWTSDAPDLTPRLDSQGHAAFVKGDDRGEKLLGVAVEGTFTSYFQGKDSPLLQPPAEDKKAPAQAKPEAKPQPSEQVAGVIEHSPESARIILFASGDFLTDQTLQLAAGASGRHDLGSLQLVTNSLDWALEDAGLLSIRGRGHYARTLVPLSREFQAGVEYLDYGLSLLGLLLVFMIYKLKSRRSRARYLRMLEGGDVA
jgi:ABC-2 type transport system permease protein